MKKLRNVISVILSVSMVLGLCPASALAASLGESNVVIEETVAEQEDPVETALTEQPAADEKEPDTMPAFSASKTIDGVKVKIDAPEGTFPEGAVLDVARVAKADKKAVEKAVEKTREDNVNVAVSYTFDIKLLDKDGKEIQPADGKKVNISFETDEISDKNLTTDVYHISDEKGSLSAEALEISEKGDTVTAQTDGFSYYTVEFTYDQKQYVMNGDTTVSLKDILDYVGLTGEVTAVSVSNESLFSASKKSGKWMVTAHQAFQTDEWMKVCVDGVEYEIKVTDAVYYNNGANYTLGLSNSGDIYVKGVSHNLGTIRVSEDNKQPGNGISLLFADVTIDANGQLKYAYRNVEYAYGIPNVKDLNGETYTASLSGSNNAWVAHVDNMYGTGAVAYFTQTYYNPTYKVTYNTNAGSDSVTGIDTNPVTVSQGSSTTLPTPVRSGYTFEGWYTADSGGDKKGAGGDSFTPTADINLYAHWSLTAANAPTISSISGTNLTFGYSSGSISVSVPAISGHSISYQWYKRGTSSSGTGTAISGATSSSYNIETGLNANTYYYYCVVTSKRNDNNQTKSTTSGNAIVTVSKAGISPVISMSDWTYGGTASNPSVSGNAGNGTVTYEYKFKTAADNEYSTTKPTDAGEYMVRATVAATANYKSGTSTADFTILKAGIILSVSIDGWTYGGTASNPSVSGNSGNGTVTYEYKLSTAEDSTYSTTKPTDAGNYTVRATVAATTNYNGGSATNNFTIGKATISPAVSIADWTYGETASDPSVSGNPGNGSVSYEYKLSTAADSEYSATKPSEAGNYTIKATIGETANYNGAAATADFTIAKAGITPSVSITGWTYGEYDPTTNAPSVTSGNPGGGNVTYEYFLDSSCQTKTTHANSGAESNGEVPVNAGTYYVKATAAETDNYNTGTDVKSFTIDRQTVTPVFDEADPASNNVIFEPGSVPNGIKPTVTLIDKQGREIPSTEYKLAFDLDEHEVVIRDKMTGSQGEGNYNIVTAYINYPFTSGTAVVKTAPKADVLTYNGEDQVLLSAGGAAENGTMAYALGTDADTEPDAAEFTADMAAIKASEAGDHFVWYKAAGDGINYMDSDPVCIRVTISKAPLKVSVNDAAITYGEAPTNNGVTYDGFVSGDDENVLKGTLSYHYTYSQGGNVNAASGKDYGVFDIIPYGLTADNYDITFAKGDLIVNKKEVTITAEVYDKIYDGTAAANIKSSKAVDMVPGDTISIVSGTAAFDNKNAGDDKTVTFTGFGLEGDKVGNYKLSGQPDSVTASISVQPITVTGIKADDKVYDGNTTASLDYGSVTYEGIVSGDVLTVSATGTFEDKNAGTGKTVNITDLILGGADVANYVLEADDSQSTADASITPKSVTITGLSAADKVYDKTATATVTGTAVVSGKVGSDDVSVVAGTAAFVDADAGTGKTVKFTGYSLTGEDKDNYKLDSQPADVTAAITPKSVTVSGITAKTKVYDGNKAAELVYTGAVFTGIEDGDVLTVSGTGTFDNANAGEDKTVTISGLVLDGSSKDNYQVASSGNQTETKADITAKALTVTADSATKVYDGTALTKNTYTNTDLAAGDSIESVTVTGSQTAVGTSDNVPSGAVIKNASSEDVTSNYAITYIKGTLEVTKKAVTITADSASKTYDGQPLVKNSFTNTELGSGDTVTATVTGSQTVFGSSDNTVSNAVIKNAGNVDVTDSYDITYAKGTLTVAQRAVTITADSADKTYDGTALTKNTVTSEGLAEGDTVTSVTVTGSQTTVGTGDNVPSAAVIKNSAEEDVTSSYAVTYANGTLTVAQRALTITADSASKVYDGTALTKNTVTSEGLAEGDTIASATVTGSQTAAGTSDNTASAAVIKNAANEDVTNNYNITYAKGTLEVTKKAVTITAGSDTKVYDGTALTKNSYTNTDLAAGDTVESVTVTGSQTAAGTSDNTVSAAVIKNAANEDVTSNYNITYAKGTLEVTKKAVTITADSASKVYDGTALTKNTVTGDGLAEGDTIASATVTGSQTAAGTSDNTASAAVIKNAANEDVTNNYNITYANGTLEVTKKTVTVSGITASNKVYDGNTDAALNCSAAVIDGKVDGDTLTVTATGTFDSAAAGEGKTVTISGITLGGADASNYVLAESGNQTAAAAAITPKPVTITIADKEKLYGTDDPELTAAVTGLVGEETLNYTLTRTAGEDAGAYAISAVLGSNPNYQVTAPDATFTINKRSVTLTSATATKVYDGTALTDSNITVGGDGFATGEGATYNVTGSQTLPGESDNAFTYALNDGTSADNYNITKTEGKLTVTDRTNEEGEDKKYEITVTASSDEVTYDGTEHSVTGFVQTAFTFNGVTYTVSGLTAEANGTDVGTYTAEVTGTAVVKDPDGNDLTAQFIVNTANGTLTVNKRNVTLTSATANKVYDGTALTNSNVTVSGDGFATGEGASFDVTGSQKVVGSSANAFTYTLNSGTKADNYNITKTEGTLTVTSRDAKYEIAPQANSGEVKYDGQNHSVTGFVTDTFTVEGNTYTVSGLTAAGEGTDAGTYTVNVSGTAVVKDSDGNDVTTEFAVTPQTGTLTINKRNVTLTSASDEKEYDGDALTNNTVTVSGDEFVDGEGAEYDVTGTRTLVGSSENTFTYTLKDNTKAGNYVVTTSFGTLTVNNRNTKYEVTLKANSGTEKYDGSEKTVSGYTIDGKAGEGTGENAVTSFEASNGKTYTITGMSAEVSATNAGEYTSNVTGTPIVKDAAGNDVTAQFTVSTESGKLSISKRSVTLTSADATKVYDGTALTDSNVTVSGDGFAAGEGASYNVTGSQKLPGESANVFTYALNDGTSADNYNITKVEGKLTVTDRTNEEGEDKKYEITVTANSAEAIYDGTEHSVTGFVQTAFTFNGVTYTVSGLTAEAKGTDAGTYTAEVTGTAVVKDPDGNDLTAQFIVNTANGTLTINKRNVTLTSATDTKTYDGTALTNSDVTVSGDGFVTGEGASFDVTGSQKVVGSSANTFTYTLADGTKADNYNITKTEGTLTVTSRDAKYEVSPQANSGEVKYDGQNHSVTGFVTDTFTVEGNTYTVSGLTAAGEGTDAGTYTVSVSGTATVKDSDGNDVTTEFAVTPQTGTLTINKRNVTLTSASDEKEYDGDALTNNTVTVSGDEFVDGEGAEYDVTGTRTLVGSSENTFTYTLKDNTKAGNYVVTTSFGTLTVNNRNTKYEVTLKANSGTEKYDGSVKTVSGYTIDGVAGEGTGESTVTSFTASNGKTYTITGMSAEVSATNAGEYTSNVTGTPVVKDAAGNDVTAQFTVSTESGKLTISKRSVTLTSATATKVYDGTALTDSDVTVSGDGFATGEGATYDVTGSQKLPGESANAFSYALNDGTSADNYNITKVEGKLTVTDRTNEEGEDKKYEITVTANSAEVIYDGTEHSVSGFVQTAFTFNGVTYTVSGLTAEANGTDAGTYTAEVTGTAVVKDPDGNDLTAQFIVNTANGTLTINKRNVTLTSASDTKTYDGKALTNDTVTTSGDGFVTGEGASFDVTGSQKVVGSSANTFTYTLADGTKADNYNITKTEGTLTVTSREAKYEIAPQANSGEVKYDGQNHSVTGFVTDTFTVDGNTYTVSGLTAAGEGTDAGTYTVSVSGTAVVKDSDGNDVTTEFAVTPQTGTLTISKRNVTLTSASDEKEYDGDALTNNTVTVSGDEFVDGEGAEYDVTGTRTLVGSSENTFTYTLKSNTKADNYNITKTEGTLTVTSRNAKYEIVPQANSDEVKYDGQSHSVSGFVTDTFTVDGNTYTVSGLTATASGTDAGTYTVSVSGTAVVKDSVGNDVTAEFAVTPQTGTLTITKRNVTLTSASDEKIYDGDALTNNNVTVSGDEFVDGEGATYDVTGSRTLPGESDNAFTYALNDGTKADNYNITKVEGKLKVTDRTNEEKYEITVTASSDEVTYDGTEHSVTGFVRTTFTFNGVTYTVSGLTAEAKGTDAGTYTAEVTGTAVVKDSKGNDLTDQFIVNTANGTLTINKRNVTLTSATDTKTYDGKALTNDTVTTSGDGFVTGEGANFDVTGSQTAVGSSANEFAYTLTDGTKADNYNITKIEGTLTVTSREAKYEIAPQAGSDEVMYDGRSHSVTGFVTDTFTVDGNTYTVSGLEVSGEGTDAGTYTVNVSGTAIVKDSDGNDVTAEFVVIPQTGTLTITKRNVTLTSASAVKEYDGDALTNNNITVSGDKFADGEGIGYDVTGTRTLVGFTENEFTYTLIDGTKADNYVITTAFGTLTVTPKMDRYEVTLKANNGNEKYDGSVKTVGGYTINGEAGEGTGKNAVTSFKASNGKTYTITGMFAEASGTNAGEYDVEVAGYPIIRDSDGNDVTSQFAIMTEDGKLIINKRSITLTSASAEKAYDGEALVNAEVTVSGDDFAEGEGASYDVTGSQTLPGESDNAFTYVMNDGTSADNYEIKIVEGKLTVTESDSIAEIAAATIGSDLVYDGTPKTLVTVGKTEGGTPMFRLGTDGKWQAESPEATEAGTYKIYYYIKGDENHSDDGSETSPKGSVEVTIKKADQAVSAEALAGTEATAGRISGLDPAKTYQYSRDGGRTWSEVKAGSTEIELAPGTYQVRYAGDKNHEAGKPVTVTVEADPLAGTEVTGGKISGLNPSKVYQYSADGGKTWKDVEAGSTEIALDPGTYLIRFAGNRNQKAGKPVTVTIAADPLAGTEVADGMISGLDPSKTYQYSADGGKTWIDIKPGSTEIELEPGTYLIRFAGDKDHEAGKPVTVTVPSKTPIQLKSVTPKKNKVNISWTKVKEADGYDVFINYCNRSAKKAAKTLKGNSKTKISISKINGKKIDPKKDIHLRVSAYKMVNGKKVTIAKSIVAHIAGAESEKNTNPKKLTLKKKNFSIKVGKKARIKATVTPVDKNKKLLNASHAAKLRFKSSDSKTASVDKKGYIKAKKKGTCIIYVYAINGLMKKVKVKVK